MPASREHIPRRPRVRRLLQQHDQKGEDLRENRHAFEQEQRQVDRARDFVSRAGLPSDAFGGTCGMLAAAFGEQV